jgi:hypothetical protein
MRLFLAQDGAKAPRAQNFRSALRDRIAAATGP